MITLIVVFLLGTFIGWPILVTIISPLFLADDYSGDGRLAFLAVAFFPHYAVFLFFAMLYRAAKNTLTRKN